MCKIVLFPVEKDDQDKKGSVVLIKNGIQFRPIIKEITNQKIEQGKDYDLENLAFEIIHKAWGRVIAKRFDFCNMRIFFNGNGNKNPEKKTIIIIKVILSKEIFEFLNSFYEHGLVSISKTVIDKIIEEGKIEDGTRNGTKVRIDESHKSLIESYFGFENS